MIQARRALLLMLAFALAGCSSALKDIELAQQRYVSGDIEGGYSVLVSPANASARSETTDALLWLMEEGKMGQDAGHFSESAAALGEASKLVDLFEHEYDKSSLGEELAAIAINQRYLIFRGSYADRMEIENLRILAALLNGNGQDAAVAARRAIERQRDVEVAQAERIKKVNAEISKRGGSKAVKDIFAKEGVDLGEGFAPYLNPLASWLSGMLQCSTGDGNDRQRGETDLRRALSMVPEQKVLLAEVEQNPYDLARQGQQQVVVLFENGVGPQLEQITIPLVTPWLGLSTIPLPSMTIPPRPADAVDASGAGLLVRTEELVDLSAIWQRDFDQRLPEIILRTALMVAAKEGATYAASEPFRRQSNSGHSSGDIGQVVILTAASLYKLFTNLADLRTWRSIPSQVSIAQLPRPQDGLLRVSLVRGGVTDANGIDVRLPDAPVTLVWCRCVVPNQLIVRAVPFGQSARASMDTLTPTQPESHDGTNPN